MSTAHRTLNPKSWILNVIHMSGDSSGPDLQAAGEDEEQRDGGWGVAEDAQLGARPGPGPGQAAPAPVLHVLQVTRGTWEL